MKHAILGLALSVALSASARADSLTLVYNGASDACAPNITLQHCVVIPAAHVTRLLAAYKALLALPPATTNAQVFEAAAASIFAGMKANVLSQEKQNAAKTAADGVSEVTMQ